MIYVLEWAEASAPRAWFAFDGDDLRRKLDARGGVPVHPMKVWPNEEAAVLALESPTEPLWHGDGWKARWALREQLIATEALAED